MRIPPLLLTGLLFTACQSPGPTNKATTAPVATDTQPTAKPAPVEATLADPPDTVSGDFNGDGRRERAWLERPAGINDSDMICADGSCTARIRFSDPALPAIAVRQCIGGHPDNLGDLYGDGRDAIGLSPEWFTSCWSAYYSWTYRSGNWRPALDTLSTHCNQLEDDPLPVKKIPGRPGWARVRYSESNDTGIAIITKDLPLRRYTDQ